MLKLFIFIALTVIGFISLLFVIEWILKQLCGKEYPE